MSLKKSDIAKNITSKISIKNSLSKDIVDSFIEIIKSESNSSDVKISNFGTFMNKVTPERIGRNPKTGKEYVISERVKLNFIVSNKVKEQLN
jgi:integration host factor subunit alpha